MPETSLNGTIIEITELNVARALAKVQGLPEDTDPWENWQELPEESRTDIILKCRRHLLARVNLNMIWEQALLADHTKQRWNEDLDVKPARLEEDRQPIGAGSRLACVASRNIEDWFIPVNPVNQNVTPEGTWQEWVGLARAILDRANSPVEDEGDLRP